MAVLFPMNQQGIMIVTGACGWKMYQWYGVFLRDEIEGIETGYLAEERSLPFAKRTEALRIVFSEKYLDIIFNVFFNTIANFCTGKLGVYLSDESMRQLLSVKLHEYKELRKKEPPLHIGQVADLNFCQHAYTAREDATEEVRAKIHGWPLEYYYAVHSTHKPKNIYFSQNLSHPYALKQFLQLVESAGMLLEISVTHTSMNDFTMGEIFAALAHIPKRIAIHNNDQLSDIFLLVLAYRLTAIIQEEEGPCYRLEYIDISHNFFTQEAIQAFVDTLQPIRLRFTSDFEVRGVNATQEKH